MLPRKASHPARVNARRGPAGSLESRIATRSGSSTHSSLLRLLLRQVAREWSDARTVFASLVADRAVQHGLVHDGKR